jgi:hypothetical protein
MVVNTETLGSSEICKATFQFCFVSHVRITQLLTDMCERSADERNLFLYYSRLRLGILDDVCFQKFQLKFGARKGNQMS